MDCSRISKKRFVREQFWSDLRSQEGKNDWICRVVFMGRRRKLFKVVENSSREIGNYFLVGSFP